MTGQILGITAMILISSKSLIYLITYIKLKISGGEAKGQIIAYSDPRSIMTGFVLIPKVTFFTSDGQTITGKPVYSWFVEVNNYIPGKKDCIIFYDLANPVKFVVKSYAELSTNIAIILIAIAGIIWQLTSLF